MLQLFFVLRKVMLKAKKLLVQLDQSIQKDDLLFSQLCKTTMHIHSHELLSKNKIMDKRLKKKPIKSAQDEMRDIFEKVHNCKNNHDCEPFHGPFIGSHLFVSF